MRSRCAHLHTELHTPSSVWWLWPVSSTLGARKVWNSLSHHTPLTQITLVSAFNKQNLIFRTAESNPRNRHTLTSLWTSVLSLPALHVPLKPPYIHQAFSPSASLKRWVCLGLGTNFFNDCVSDYRSLSCPCTQRNPEGLASSLYLNTQIQEWMICVLSLYSPLPKKKYSQ